jgi:L-seryl-tRNA(Ser) seleniumtransferase
MEPPNPVNAQLRQLPAVDRLVERAARGTDLRRWSLLAAAREVLARCRAELREETAALRVDPDALVHAVRARARGLETPFPRRVINATGVILHTNLGRAPLAPAAVEAVGAIAGRYSNLEFDLETGERGSRLDQAAGLLTALSGAPAALVVNNAAAALLLAVDTLAAGREVLISRGELVEIGGSFRVPDILAASRARLREVGTTNRTHESDYASAIGPETGMLLKVHRSNFRLEGFTAEVTLGRLAQLARAHGLPLVEDRGSATFLDLRPHGVPEREAWAGLDEGADLVVFSGDKLLGGPQAGIALGRADLIARMRRSPLARALRVDKLTLAALDWTLRALLDGREREIPVLRMLLARPDELAERCERIAAGLRAAGFAKVSVEGGTTPVGGGSLPDFELPGALVRIDLGESAAGALAARLRRGDPAVLVRVQRGALCIDPRTLDESELDALVCLLAAARAEAR